MEEKKPEYLYNPQMCPCPRGVKAGCPRYRNCEACMEFHHKSSRTPLTACERLAIKETERMYEEAEAANRK